MSNELVVSLKPDDPNDPWLVIHVESIAALRGACQQIVTEGIGAVIHEANAAFKAQLVAAKGLGAVPVAAPAAPTAPAPAAPVQTEAPAPSCKHGPQKWIPRKPGWNKSIEKGGWFCPAPKDAADKCKPEFV